MGLIKSIIDNIFALVGLILILAIGGVVIPGILYTLLIIGCYLAPIFLTVKFLYKIFVAGGPMVKWLVVVGTFFAIDYIMQNTEKMLMVWGFAAFVCCIYVLFCHALKHDTEHIQ